MIEITKRCKFSGETVLISNEERGRHAYELNLIKQPSYHDGTPRPSWEELNPLAKRTWRKKKGNLT